MKQRRNHGVAVMLWVIVDRDFHGDKSVISGFREGFSLGMTNGVRWQKERLTRSVRRVAGRYGPVARATLVCKRSFMVVKSVITGILWEVFSRDPGWG